MKIRVTSDLHTDINGINFGFVDKLDEVDMNIIAGDVAGSYQAERDFLSKLHNTVVVGGNHLGYEYNSNRLLNFSFDINNPLEETKEYCINNLTKLKNINYLNDSFIKINDKIIFGGTMYSNFELYGKHNKKLCKHVAERWMNDFRLVHTYKKSKKLVCPVSATDYVRWFNKFLRELNKCINSTTEDIIVVSHFAPSKKSVSEYYGHQGKTTFLQPGYELNACYASNLEQFILDNPRIKLWCHGHMHDSFDYNIGNCRVVCEPYGYKCDTTLNPNEYEGKIIELN